SQTIGGAVNTPHASVHNTAPSDPSTDYPSAGVSNDSSRMRVARSRRGALERRAFTDAGGASERPAFTDAGGASERAVFADSGDGLERAGFTDSGDALERAGLTGAGGKRAGTRPWVRRYSPKI